MQILSCLTTAACVILALTGCRKEEVRSYRAPKDPAKPVPTMSQTEMPPGHPPTQEMPPGHPTVGNTPAAASVMEAPAVSAASDLTWSAPSQWQTKPIPSSGMRRGSFSIKGGGTAEADLSIIMLGGPAGGLLDNINRWRGQIGLGPIDATKLAEEVVQIKTLSGLEMNVVDMTNAGGERILGAILTREGQSWFFKLKGPAELITKEKQVFIEFLKTVKAP
jgi:hypothetical protein